MLKTCCDCKRRRSLKKFYGNRARRDGHQTFCIDCNTARRRKDRAAHPARNKQYHQRYYTANRKRLIKTGCQWATNNPGLATAKWMKRHAAKLRATPAWADLEKIAGIYKRAAKRGLHVDHIVPLQSKKVCGLHCEANLRAYSESKNKSKSNRSWPNMAKD